MSIASGKWRRIALPSFSLLATTMPLVAQQPRLLRDIVPGTNPVQAEHPVVALGPDMLYRASTAANCSRCRSPSALAARRRSAST